MSVNSVHLIGRLGQDPELRVTSGGKQVCTFSIATDGYGKDTPPDWHSIVVWDKIAENCNQYFHKGSQVFVGGRIVYQKWQDKKEPDVTRYATKIVAHTVQFLDGKSKSESHDEAVPANPETDDLPF